MEVLLMMVLIACVGIVINMLIGKKPEKQPYRCHKHRWKRVNNILFCTRYDWAPEVEQKAEEMFNKLDKKD